MRCHGEFFNRPGSLARLFESTMAAPVLSDSPTMFSLLQFDAPVLIAVVCVMLFAGLVHGTLGLGFPMVATPMLATMMDVRSAILITLLPTIAVNIFSIATSPSGLEKLKPFRWLIGFSLVGAIVGSQVLASVDPTPFRLMLAALILLYLWNNLRLSQQWLSTNAFLAMMIFGLIALTDSVVSPNRSSC